MLRVTRNITATAFVFAALVAPAGAQQDLRSPDARDAARMADGIVSRDLRSPDARDAARLPNGGRPSDVSTPVQQVTESPSGGFDWGDAGIGAAGMLAIVALATGSALLITGYRRRRRGFHVATG